MYIVCLEYLHLSKSFIKFVHKFGSDFIDILTWKARDVALSELLNTQIKIQDDFIVPVHTQIHKNQLLNT
jgi:hypothetical protein